MSSIKDLLVKHKLRNTPFRSKVLEVFLSVPHAALSNSNLESRLGEHDRITLYRTLKSFEEKELIHQVSDGSNEMKYALCLDGCEIHHSAQEHAHFHCESCGDTFCLATMGTIDIPLPADYTLKKINLTITGTCAKCN